MRRSVLLQITVQCPHFHRPVVAQMNTVIERLVACADSDQCRDPAPAGSGHEHERPVPRGCPVFPSLAK
jgi:hypothetical protein